MTAESVGGFSHFNLFDNEFNENSNSISLSFKVVAVFHTQPVWIDYRFLAAGHDLGHSVCKAVD